MEKQTFRYALAFALTIACTMALEILFAYFPNPLLALIAPMDGSVWQKLKLFFWPRLAAAALLTRFEKTDRTRCWGAHFLSMLITPVFYIGLFYGCTCGFALEASDVIPILYLLVTAFGFWIADFFQRKYGGPLYTGVYLMMLCIYGAGLTLFSFAAPELPIFLDPQMAAIYAR